MLQQARYDSLLAAIDAPGVDALSLIVGLQRFTPGAQGINAYFQVTHQSVAPFTRTDVWALNALKGQFVGEGGGKEPRGRSSWPRWHKKN